MSGKAHGIDSRKIARENIRALRGLYGDTNPALAELLCVKDGTVEDYFGNRGFPSERLDELSNYYGVPKNILCSADFGELVRLFEEIDFESGDLIEQQRRAFPIFDVKVAKDSKFKKALSLQKELMYGSSYHTGTMLYEAALVRCENLYRECIFENDGGSDSPIYVASFANLVTLFVFSYVVDCTDSIFKDTVLLKEIGKSGSIDSRAMLRLSRKFRCGIDESMQVTPYDGLYKVLSLMKRNANGELLRDLGDYYYALLCTMGILWTGLDGGNAYVAGSNMMHFCAASGNRFCRRIIEASLEDGKESIFSEHDEFAKLFNF